MRRTIPQGLFVSALLLLSGLPSVVSSAQEVVSQAQEAAPPAQAVAPSKQAGARRAEELFQSLEEKLLRGTAWVVRAQTSSEGAFESSLSGAVALRQGNIARIELNGSFGGKFVDAFLISDGAVLLYGEAQAGSFEDAAPWALNEAVIVGLTRMGLLHNFARLTAADPPDRMKGGVRDWVEVTGFSLGEIETVNEQPALPISFALVVAGQPAGEATLWLNEATGLPVQRRQIVNFETGSMTVIETYDFEDLPAHP